MKDIKVADSFKEYAESMEWWSQPHSPIEFYAEAVAMTRRSEERLVGKE